MPFFQSVDGVSLHYRDCGRGVPVVFLHCYALDSNAWMYQAAPLIRNGYRTILLDRRGHGRSECSGTGYDADTLATDLACLLDHLRIESVCLVGHSMSAGEIARYIARNGNQRTRRIVFVSPSTPLLIKTPDNPSGFEPAVLDHLVMAVEDDFPKILKNMVASLWSDGDAVSEELKQWVYGLGLQTSLIAAGECLKTGWLTDFYNDLKTIKVPTLIIHGERDQLAPLDLCGKPTAAAVSDSRLIVYDSAGHGLPISRRSQLSKDLLDFLRDA